VRRRLSLLLETSLHYAAGAEDLTIVGFDLRCAVWDFKTLVHLLSRI